MSILTPFFNLFKLQKSDPYAISQFNANMDTIDTEMHKPPLTVNEIEPDPETRNIPIEVVPLADNLTSEEAQINTGTYIIRTSGGEASIENGNAWLSDIKGNMVKTGFVPESLEMTVTLADPTTENPIEATIDRDTFVEEVTSSSTITLTYTTGWSTDPATYGITVTGTPASGDQIVVVYVKENRGTITTASPTSFVSTGWNLYNHAAGYARVAKYSEEYGFMIDGSYTDVSFSATLDGEHSAITPVNGYFTVPSDGYVFVTGGNSTDTEIWMTWSDWIEEANGGVFAAYSQTSIDLSGVMVDFPDGLMKIGNVYDEINLNTGKAYSRIQKLEYTQENLEAVIASGVPYDADTGYIYAVRVYPVTYTISLDGEYTVSDHGIETFLGTSLPVTASSLYGNDLKGKLRRDVVTISQQNLTDAQKAQVLQNIGAAGLETAMIADNLTSRLWGKKVSIIGDSISTYSGYIKSGYATWYPNTSAPDVTSVEDTWWKKVLENSGAVLEVNASYSGSRVTNTDANKPDFFARTTSSVIGNPDAIIVALGTNDSNNSVSLGNYDYSTTYTSLSEATFREAYIKGMKSLITNFPNAKIYGVILYMGGDYSNSIKSICAMLGVEVIDCNGYEKASGSHPNKIGMRHIASSFLYPNRLETYGLQVADTSFPITLEGNCLFLIIYITQNANRYGMWIVNSSSTAITAFAIAKGNDVSTSISGLTFTITHAGSSTARISVIRLYGYGGIK